MTTRTPTRTSPRRCSCCHAPYGQGCMRDRTCHCTVESCPRCSRCLAHCTCGREAASNKIRCTQLHKIVSCGIIEETESRSVKGGCVDQYVFNSRGGCRRTETPRRDGQTNVAHWKDAGPQIRRRVARRSNRTRRVEEATRKSVQETNSGKLIHCVVFSVTALASAIACNPLTPTSQLAATSCQFYDASPDSVKALVADREVYPHE